MPGIIKFELFIFLGVLLIILFKLLIDTEEILLKEPVWIKFVDIRLCCRLFSYFLKSYCFRWLGGRLRGPIEPSNLWLWGQYHDFF
jgi:hypothetical protein